MDVCILLFFACHGFRLRHTTSHKFGKKSRVLVADCEMFCIAFMLGAKIMPDMLTGRQVTEI